MSTGTNNGPSKTAGQWHSTKGDVKESVGKTFGATGLQQGGAQEHAEGQAQKQAGRGVGYAQGTAEHAKGKKDQWVGSATADRGQQAAGDYHTNKGDATQTYNRTF